MQYMLDDVVRASFAVYRGLDVRRFIASLTEQLFDVTGANLACFYSLEGPSARLMYRRGRFEVPRTLSAREEPLAFIGDSRETVVLTARKHSPFLPLLLHRDMGSGIAAPLVSGNRVEALVILNSLEEEFFNRRRLRFTETLMQMAGEYFHNAVLHRRLRDYTRRVQALERYQENIFTSMSNLLVTTDMEGNIRYFNRAAAQRFGLTPEHVGRNLVSLFTGRMGEEILDLIREAVGEGTEIVEAEGIFRLGWEPDGSAGEGTGKQGQAGGPNAEDTREMDFSLNTSPLRGRGNRLEGCTLLFTDQSRERELEREVCSARRSVRTATEERRRIKDMFSRYLSQELVSRLVADPAAVHLGGDKKMATVMFADIRGYTAFSEGRDPEYIIQVLNEYFSEAVELVIRHKGFIDKYIGDCIMAAWGVPLESEETDARLAVSCALAIQGAVSSPERRFFTGEAAGLAIGMGLHSGPLVAGNIGSTRRVDYTMIGDTVNIAARLEGVAGPGEVIITEDTRRLLDDRFELEARDPVQVKGKTEPLHIYNVTRKAV
ncbi:MAG: adenylate/guanylate cyclase domain-containing protein [Spirochaetota bacterium]